MLGRRCAFVLVRFRHKNLLVGVRKTSFRLKVLPSGRHNNWKSSRDLFFFFLFFFKYPVVSYFSSVTPPPPLLLPQMKVRSLRYIVTHIRNVKATCTQAKKKKILMMGCRGWVQESQPEDRSCSVVCWSGRKSLQLVIQTAEPTWSWFQGYLNKTNMIWSAVRRLHRAQRILKDNIHPATVCSPCCQTAGQAVRLLNSQPWRAFLSPKNWWLFINYCLLFVILCACSVSNNNKDFTA